MLIARDGRDALRLARSEQPDLIFLDLMLPAIDGLDVCRTLRQESQVPIIMLTARGEAQASYGLGLSIAKALVEAHHGRIWVESDPGHGAAFTFALPVKVVY